jgi:hypothetical protein
MKKFWLVLLSLGLIVAFSASAFAVDVKVGADYYVGGLYLNKTSLVSAQEGENFANPSTAFFYQGLRVGADFVVSPSLKLVTQFDAMERIWGGARSNTFVSDANGAGTRAEAENIAFRKVYIDYTSPIGLFKVGYMQDYEWGTVFGDRTSGTTVGQIQYFFQKGPFTGFIGYAKEADNSASAVGGYPVTDMDYDSYRLAGIYNFKNGEAGVLFLFNRNATDKADYYLSGGAPSAAGYLQNVYVIDPYVKTKIGPVKLQAEAQYWFGNAAKWEDERSPAIFEPPPLHFMPDVNIGALSIFIDASADLGMFYAGGSFAYLSGDDPGTNDKVEGGINTAGLDWNPCLIMFNHELNYWGGTIYGHNGSALNEEMSNAWFFQGRVGVKPTPQWNVLLTLSHAFADKKPVAYDLPWYPTYGGGTYGTEVDVTATYKITNNLNYMFGAGYLFTGDYFKGAANGAPDEPTKDVNNNFILINKLTLSF